jgi:hypothetical protein
MATLRPDADSSTGSWTNESGASTLYASIDETSASDTDYIKSGTGSNDVCKIRLSNPGGAVTSPMVISYRYYKEANNATVVNLRVRLLQGTTEIAAWEHTGISNTPAVANQTLTSPQFAAITDFDDLFLEFTKDAVVEETETTAFFTAVATAGLTAPSTAWRTAYNNLIAAGKANGWWAECDVIRIFASYDAAVALRNLKSDTVHMTTAGTAPTFTAKQGYHSNGVGRLVSTYNPTTFGGAQFLQNDAHYSVWSNTAGQVTATDFGIWSGTAGCFLNIRSTSDVINGRINEGVNYAPANTNGDGHFLNNRTGSNTAQYYRNGSTLGAANTGTSIAVVSATESVGGIASGNSNRQYAASSIGGALTTGQITSMYNDLQAFFTEIAGL